MTSFWLRVGVVLAVFGSTGGIVTRGHAQAAPAPAAPAAPDADADAAARAQAKEQFQAGVAAYEAQRYGDALTHFQEAYRIKPHPLVRVNMANCYERLGKPLLAIFHFESFLKESEPNAAQRGEVTEALRLLRAKISELTLRVAPDGATVTIDSGEQRRSPISEPIQLEAGMHVVEVSLSGYQTQKRDLVLEGGQQTSVEITLERAGAPVAAAPAPLPEPAAAQEPSAAQPVAQATDSESVVLATEPTDGASESRTLMPTIGWVTAGASAAMFLGALITGQLALSAEADFEDSRDTARDITGATPLERRSAYEDALEAADRADALAVASDIFLVAGIVGVGATVYLAIDHHSGGESDSGASARLTVAPTRISIDGRF
jgi:tetratricopeptide (TPR) repeat protein